MPCLFRPRRSLVHALTTEHEANVCLFSSGHLRQAPVNALLTELWSKCQHRLLHPIKAVSGTCSINWTVKQMYALSPSSFQDSLWSMLYQLNYEANVCLVSFRVMLFQLNNEANVCFVSFLLWRQSLLNALSTELLSKCLPCLLFAIKTVSGTCSINCTIKQIAMNWTVKCL